MIVVWKYQFFLSAVLCCVSVSEVISKDRQLIIWDFVVFLFDGTFVLQMLMMDFSMNVWWISIFTIFLLYL